MKCQGSTSNSHPPTCSTFSYNPLPSVDVSSMHYCLTCPAAWLENILSFPFQTIGRENSCGLVMRKIVFISVFQFVMLFLRNGEVLLSSSVTWKKWQKQRYNSQFYFFFTEYPEEISILISKMEMIILIHLWQVHHNLKIKVLCTTKYFYYYYFDV